MKRKGLMITSIVLAAVLLAGMVAAYLTAASVYKKSFNYRCITSVTDRFDIETFPAMTRSRHTFPTRQGHLLTGYLYGSADGAAPKALVVFAHGLGAGGQSGYLPIFDYLVQGGYCVFAYDATGNDESEGEAIGSLIQGYIDMDYAVTYAQSLEETAGLPLVLMGYSWGALSAGNTLNTHPEAVAVVTIAGWNRARDLVEAGTRKKLGDAAGLVMPFISLYELVTYGKYASSTAMKGFERSDCGAMIIHGELDGTVPIQYGYDIYAAKYENDPRFTFVRYSDRGHVNILPKSNTGFAGELLAQIVAFCDKWVG